MRNLMIIITGILILFSGYSTAYSQLLNHPESIVYDSERNRYLVSNWDSGNMIQIDSSGVQDTFVANQYCYAGMHIMGDVIYVSGRDQGVRGFDLESGQLVMHVSTPASAMLNDITSDNQGYLYVSAPNVNEVYKIDPVSGNWSTFVSSGVISPNGLCYDEPNNRLLLVSSRNSSPLQAISLADSSVSVIAYTGLSILDGLTMDNRRNLYFSSWNSNAVFKYDSTFTNPPEQVSVHSPSPADIDFISELNVLAVPVFYGNYIDFVDLSSTPVEHSQYAAPSAFDISIYPNPFNAVAAIKYKLESPSYVNIGIYDLLGRRIEVLQDDCFPAGIHRVLWDATERPSGIYLYRFQVDGKIENGKMTLSK